MREFLGVGELNKSILGFGDELMFDYDAENATLIVSIFEDNHYQDEVHIDMRTALKSGIG